MVGSLQRSGERDGDLWSVTAAGRRPPRWTTSAATRAADFGLLASAALRLTAVAGFALAAAFVYFTATIPDPLVLRHKENAPLVRILARDGSLLAERGGAAPYVPIDLLPRHLIDAVLAIEDRRFFSHCGRRPCRA